MTLAISSARPRVLYQYASVGAHINHELASEANRLGAALEQFQATCREPGFAMHVSYLADELHGYVRWVSPIDNWVHNVGSGFERADSTRVKEALWGALGKVLEGIFQTGKFIIDNAESFVGIVFVLSLRGSAQAPRVSLSWVRVLNLSPQSVRTFFGITPKTLNMVNVVKYWDKAAKGIILLVIAYQWVKDFREYEGTELISAIAVDAILIYGVAQIALWVGGAIAGAAIFASLPAIAVGAIAVGATIVIGIGLDWVINHFGIRNWLIEQGDKVVQDTLKTVQMAANWAKDATSDVYDWGKNTVKSLDDRVFAPIASTIAKGVDAVHSWVDEAARILKKKFDQAINSIRSVGDVNEPPPSEPAPIEGTPPGGTPPPDPIPQVPDPQGGVEKIINTIAVFNVESNPDYQAYHDNNPSTDDTYCNIYVMDVAKSLDIPLPEYLKWPGGKEIDRYLDANLAIKWLNGDFFERDMPKDMHQGPDRGWQKIDSDKAAKLASAGYFVVVGWENPNPGEAGHMAIIRPESTDGDHIRIAQAGASNFSDGSLQDGFSTKEPLEYFVYFGPILSDNNQSA